MTRPNTPANHTLQNHASQDDTARQNVMPAAAPLAMPTQDLSGPFSDSAAPGPLPVKGTRFYRLATLVPALTITAVFMFIFSDWFRRDGFTFIEVSMITLVGFSAFWIALSVAASGIGLFAPRRETRPSHPSQSFDVALLMPLYNEDTGAVSKRIRAMLNDLENTPSQHNFALFVLSDTTNDQIALDERQMITGLQRNNPDSIKVWYRRRPENTERKTGNIRDWIENHGGAWAAFITLDADSLMSATTINRLANELSVRDDTALIQTVPRLMGANTLFARIQQFANNTYGLVLARGLDRWSGNAGNYWGHNAIIRTSAFAACAGLPKLSGHNAFSGTIKSHDFVEAALLRRAGWSVRLMPKLTDSYEETPQNIVDYILRDYRWCQGNLQHLRILGSAGFTNVSRFHMLQGAMGYLSSVIWFLLLVLWVLMGRSEDQSVFRYFTDANPLFPQWPQMDTVSRLVVLCFMAGMLLTPKLLGIIAALRHDPTLITPVAQVRFLISAILEILLSFLLAPILMIQHVKSVMRTVSGFDAGWASQNRSDSAYGFWFLTRFHWLELTTGALLTTGIMTGIVSLWLVPVALCLSLSPLLSAIICSPLPQAGPLAGILPTRELTNPAPVIIEATSGATLNTPPDFALAPQTSA